MAKAKLVTLFWFNLVAFVAHQICLIMRAFMTAAMVGVKPRWQHSDWAFVDRLLYWDSGGWTMNEMTWTVAPLQRNSE